MTSAEFKAARSVKKTGDFNQQGAAAPTTPQGNEARHEKDRDNV